MVALAVVPPSLAVTGMLAAGPLAALAGCTIRALSEPV